MSETTIDSLRLKVGRSFGYLFDFGDNWQHQINVESIGATTTDTGLEVHAWIDEGTYEKGRKVSDEELAECNIKRHEYHGEWNYEIHPRAN